MKYKEEMFMNNMVLLHISNVFLTFHTQILSFQCNLKKKEIFKSNFLLFYILS